MTTRALVRATGLFAIVVVGYTAAGTGLAARLGPRGPTSEMLVSGAVIAGLWMVGLVASGTPAGLSIPLLALAPGAALILGWRAARRSPSTTIALHCVGLAALAAGFGLFLLWGGGTVILAGRPYDPGWCVTSGPAARPTWRRTPSTTASARA